MVIKDIESGVCQDTHEYYCYHCCTWSEKNNWGPGRIWCPNCNKKALTPAEKIKND